MQCSLRFEAVASRFEPFVHELHALFGVCGVRYGYAADVTRFAEEVGNDGPLRSGVRSTVRSVLRRVPEPVSHGNLVELILVAVGGAEIDEDAPAVQQAERMLSPLVGEAMTAQLGALNAEMARDVSPGDACKRHEGLGVEIPGGLEEAASVAKMRPRLVAWHSPPVFVWAALVCGMLLAPCMYLLSRSHGPAAPDAPGWATLPMHPVTQAEAPVVPDFRESDERFNAALNDLGTDLPRRTPQLHSNARKTGEASQPNRLEPVQPARGLGAEVPQDTDGDTGFQDTDMPGRDRTMTAAPAATQDPLQTHSPEF